MILKNQKKKLRDYINVKVVGFGILYLSIFIALCFIGRSYGNERYISFWIAINYLTLLLNIKYYWFFGRTPDQYNELGLKTVKDNQIGVQTNFLNPLYRKGVIKRDKKDNFIKMSKIKGIYYLQIQALIQSVILLGLILCEFLFVLKNIRYIPFAIIMVNKVILIYIFIGYILLLVIQRYYHYLIDRERKRIFRPLLEIGFLKPNTEAKKYDTLKFKQLSKSNIIKNFYLLYNYVDHFDMILEQESTEISICIGEDISCCKTQILVQFCAYKLQQKHIEKIENVVRSFIKRGVKNKKFPAAPIFLTYIIYVDVTSKIFSELIYKGIACQKDISILLVGIITDSHSIYINGIQKESDQYKHFKNNVLKLLGIIPLDKDLI